MQDAPSIRENLLSAFERAERTSDPAVRAELLTAAVIGGGPTGIELAGAIADLGREVVARECPKINPDDVHVMLVENEVIASSTSSIRVFLLPPSDSSKSSALTFG